MRYICFYFFLVLLVSGTVTAGYSDLNFEYTRDRKIVMSYNLVSNDSSDTMPVFKLTMTADIGGKEPYVPKTLSGDGAKGVIIGAGPKKTIWDAGKDCKSYDTDSIKIKFDVQEVSKSATYLCIDLVKFTLHFQINPPDLSDNNCKTKELWLRRIEPGTFMMGSPIEVGRYSTEVQHEVTLTKAFYIGIFEVTQAQFKKIVGYNTSKFIDPTRPVERVSFRVLRGVQDGWSWPKSSLIDSNYVYRLVKHRRNYVDEDGYPDYDEWYTEKYHDTFFYALRNKAGGLLFDLPTEAQWEYACRAGTTTSLNNGFNVTALDKCSNLEKVGWYIDNAFYKKANETHPVGEKDPNTWGLYDMHGNVSELCLDWYSTYGSEPTTDPVGAQTGSGRVLRGGSWKDKAGWCRSASRAEQYQGEDGKHNYWYDEDYLDRYDGDCGFRIVLNGQSDL